MTKTEKLLQEGKKIIAEREAKKEAEREAELKEMNAKALAMFEGARTEALRLFDPVGSEIPIQPCIHDESWFLNDNTLFKNCFFYVRLSENHGKIMVHLEGRRINGEWTWVVNEYKKFVVENNFVVGDEECGENNLSVYGRGNGLFTNSLAEALAIADMESGNYVAVREKAKKQKQSLSNLIEKSIRKKTIAEEFIELLDHWHASRHDDDE